MRSSRYLIPLLIALLYAPTLKFGSSGIPLNEAILYAYTACHVISHRKIKIDGLTKTALVYFSTFGLSLIFTCLASQSSINGFDIFQLRLITQLICVALVTQDIATASAHTPRGRRFTLLLICIASTPAILTFLQYFNVLGIGVASRAIYNTFEGFLSLDELAEIRAASVFRSYFNATIYFFLISAAAFSLLLVKKPRPSSVAAASIILITILAAQAYTGRTGLISTPIFIGLAYCLSALPSKIKLTARITTLLLASAGSIAILSIIYESGALNSLSWAAEPFIALLNGDSLNAVSSVSDMQGMNERFLSYLTSNPDILIFPRHTYNLDYTMSEIYTDSFYFQELYRYGIYGAISYVVFIAMMIRLALKEERASLLLLIIIFLAIFNYKGGNVFTMEKTLYGFVFAWRIIQSKNQKTTSKIQSPSIIGIMSATTKYVK